MFPLKKIVFLIFLTSPNLMVFGGCSKKQDLPIEEKAEKQALFTDAEKNAIKIADKKAEAVLSERNARTQALRNDSSFEEEYPEYFLKDYSKKIKQIVDENNRPCFEIEYDYKKEHVPTLGGIVWFKIRVYPDTGEVDFWGLK